MSDRTPQSIEKFERLKAILREMFQLDRGDLDFGLYRIMNLKAAEIEAFLDHDLLPQVKTALAGNTTDRLAEWEKELAQAHERAHDVEKRIRETEPTLRLRAYILSVTPPDMIDDGSRSSNDWHGDGVYFLNQPDCLKQVIAHALGS